jgi:hypothetical protein
VTTIDDDLPPDSDPMIVRPGPVRWFPISSVVGPSALGMSDAGEWVLGMRSGPSGVKLFSTESKPFLYIVPLLDRLPRLVMNDVKWALRWTCLWYGLEWPDAEEHP